MRMGYLAPGHIPESIVLAPLEAGSAGWDYVDQEAVVAEDTPAAGHASGPIVPMPLGFGDAGLNWVRQQGSFMWKDVSMADRSAGFFALASILEKGDAGLGDAGSLVAAATVGGSRCYEPFHEYVVRTPTGGGKTVSSFLVAAMEQFRSHLTQISMANVTASMVQSAQLSTDLRTYIGQTKPYSVDRHWVLAEYTVLAASLLALDRERRLKEGCGEWFRLKGVDGIKPVVLPISSDLVGLHVSSSLSRCLLGSNGNWPVTHDLVDIRWADDLVAKSPDRKELAHLLSMLPLMVEFTPAIRELHRRACKALAQRPVRGVEFLDGRGVQTKSCGASDETRLVKHDPFCGSHYFVPRSPKKYKGIMGDELLNKKAGLQSGNGSISIKGVKLTSYSARATVAPKPADEEIIKREPVRLSLVGVPIQFSSEAQSPFSTKKVLQILMGKLPKPEILD